ncbi:hypothetical protein [Pampinifervens florentissimum]|uniref:hypothetical protein n=1 Tax=Pampinifervens florentissimum TaxID=1632019 RepID=UPI0013B4901B|nr:hypothetical protein [Hydrogenobacter sp. T-8]QID32416.1 hypothetical protein G3M65_00905 [Hydrogenobacter sp. T-8]
MRRWLFLIPFLLSMAEPVKDSKLRVELEDRDGLKHSLRGLVCNGRNHLRVREGKVEYAVNFPSLRSIEVLSQDGPQLKVRLSFKDGPSKDYFIPANTYCKGNSQAGEAGFYLRDIKTIFIKTEEK